MNQEQLDKVRDGKGFIAALDQSGGSTPKALKLYGVERGRLLATTTRCSTASTRCAAASSPARASPASGSSAPSSSRMTMDREIEGRDTADYLWSVKGVVPVPEGRQGPGRRGRRRPGHEADARPRRPARAGRRPRASSARRCARSSSWPTRPASRPSSTSSSRSAGRSSAAGLVPIIEPEVDIHSPQKAEAEALLKAAILAPARRARRPTSR